MKIVVVSGGFDPVHSGHVLLMNSAKTYGDYLIVGLNSDAWLTRKKGRPFMTYDERRAVVGNLKAVDEIIEFDDTDNTACDLLEQVKIKYPNHQIIFVNGGDRTEHNIPEMAVQDVIFEFGVGGNNKANSSSWILQEWKEPKTERPWGYYRVLYDIPGCKVKELTVNPGRCLSMQRHHNRSEYWLVSEGSAVVAGLLPNGTIVSQIKLQKHAEYHVLTDQWHQLINPYDVVCKIIEIQYGVACDENDIERIE
jgi:cytidyltransferase-like protein